MINKCLLYTSKTEPIKNTNNYSWTVPHSKHRADSFIYITAHMNETNICSEFMNETLKGPPTSELKTMSSAYANALIMTLATNKPAQCGLDEILRANSNEDKVSTCRVPLPIVKQLNTALCQGTQCITVPEC
jgi:hypothetical protein